MQWRDFLRIVGEEPVFTTALLLAGDVSPATIHLQLSRWAKAGKVIPLRRGVYVLAEPYRKVSAHPFLLANRLKRASYVSLQSALAYYGTIPEYVPVVTSVTTGRPETVTSRVGTFSFRHVHTSLFTGYRRIEVAPRQFAMIATPEKGLLDLVYLTPEADRREYLDELRLQHLDQLDMDALSRLAYESGTPKLVRAAKRIAWFASETTYQEL
jgi:predicted transcriptional regulator of viral defense system